VEKLFYHSTIKKEISEVMGIKKFKAYTGDTDEDYDSESGNDEENDFYYLKRKEDEIAEFIYKNYIQFRDEVTSL
jgi:hypothetical protein